MTTPLKIKIDSVKKLIRRNAINHLENLLLKLHPADIAIIIKNLSDLDRKKIWNILGGKPILSKVILELEESQIIELFETMNSKEIAMLLNEMESDDAANILMLVDEERISEILSYMDKQKASRVERLLRYPEDSAGFTMNPNFFALHEDTTVKEATKVLHKAENLEMVFYLYVVDSEGKLSGVVSLRQLILNPPERKLKEVMTRDVIKVDVYTDREEVAKIVERYDLLAVPVVDTNNRLVGIITVDDVIDIIREETTEDIYKMAGTTDDELIIGNRSFWIAKVRSPWLLITFFGELITAFIISYFHGKVQEFAVLASFIPLIMAMAGNVGTQSSTILIRGLALGKITKKDMVKVIFKEVRVGVIMGVLLGLLLSIVAPILGVDVKVGVVLGVAMLSAIIFATFIGSIVPATLIKMKLDPAVASSPLISTLNDITGLTIYFTISLLLLNIFV
ncbi:MAG: magnesium transporter [Deferribacterota bacterium]|nr:magnesium transporter [Deferribacterota bacterium]